MSKRPGMTKADLNVLLDTITNERDKAQEKLLKVAEACREKRTKLFADGFCMDILKIIEMYPDEQGGFHSHPDAAVPARK